MVETRSRNGWVIWLSLVLALLLSVAPMPAFLEAGRPLWLALFLTYWALALPHRVGMVAAWLFGLFADVLYGSLLGQNALVLMLTTFFVLTLHQRLRLFPLWQQSLVLLVLFGIPQLVQLWLFALAFHYCFLVIFLRHFRFFIEPVPVCLTFLEGLDGLMQIGVPRFYMTDAIIVAALLFLLFRRLVDTKLRYISLPGDFFPLLLLLGLVGSGIWMRYLGKTDIATIKAFTMGLATLSPVSPAGLSPIFFLHLFFVTSLLVYFPFSKLMHMGGVFLSPTRNLPNNSRAVHHDNPWNPPKKYHTYAEYEDDFRDLMDEAGLPLEITPEQAAAAAAKE